MKVGKSKKKSFAKTVVLNETTLFLPLFLLALLLMIFSAFRPAFLTSLSTHTVNAVSPVLQTLYTPFQVISQNLTNVTQVAELKAENALLKSENARLKDWYQTALMLDAENQSLQSLLNLQAPMEYKFVTAKTLSDVSNAFSQTLLVASGLDAEIEKNHIALSGEGVIGRVIEVDQNFSRILLVTDYNSRVPVQIEGSNLKAIMTGNNSNRPTLKFFTHEGSAIQNGNVVVTSGDGDIFPAGLPIGVVDKMVDGQAEIGLFSNINDMDFVRILQTNKTAHLILSNQ